jgi:hypothetical protein
MPTEENNQTQLPALTAESLTAYINRLGPEELERAATQAEADLATFLAQNFRLTPRQEEGFRRIPREVWISVVSSAVFSIKDGAAVNFRQPKAGGRVYLNVRGEERLDARPDRIEETGRITYRGNGWSISLVGGVDRGTGGWFIWIEIAGHFC